MTGTTPGRRDRLRAETVVEIKTTARRLLVAGGPAGVTVRAVAREMGLTAPAIYRYFDGLESLVRALVADLFEELRVAVDEAGAAPAGAEPVVRLGHMMRAFRRWALARPAEFTLMFGSPVPGVAAPGEAATRFGEAFFTVLGELYASRPFGVDVPELPGTTLREAFRPYRELFGDRFPLPVVYLFVASWTRLYGIVAMEVFGQLAWAMTDAEPLFELELTRTLEQLTR